MTVPSLIKWTGSKRALAHTIAGEFPAHDRYFEPFLGGGALLYLVGRPGALAGDLYEPLVSLWRLVQATPETVVESYRTQWTRLQVELAGLGDGNPSRGSGLPRAYYDVRARFNATADPLDLCFLMRTCVNGIVRFNTRGEFNNSFHLSRRGMHPDRFARAVAAWHTRLRGVGLVCADYTDTVAPARQGDLVYLDPPYAANRHRYVADLDLDRLFEVLRDLNTRRVHWALSFDGRRGSATLARAIPRDLYRRRLVLDGGSSAVKRVLDGPVEPVQESLYLNY